MLKLRKEKRIEKKELKGGVFVKAYKLTNNVNELNYRVIVRELKN